MEENKENVVAEEPIRGKVPAEEKEEQVKEHVSIIVPTATSTDVAKPRRKDLEKHHDVILERLQKGHTVRAIHTDLGVTRWMLKNYIDEHEDLKQAFLDSREDYLDLCEEVVNDIAMTDCNMVETELGYQARVDGRSLATKLNAAKLRLERLGGHRGWNAKIETNEVGNGGRVPIIYCGEVTDEDLAKCDEMVRLANEEAMKGLEGIPHG